MPKEDKSGKTIFAPIILTGTISDILTRYEAERIHCIDAARATNLIELSHRVPDANRPKAKPTGAGSLYHFSWGTVVKVKSQLEIQQLTQIEAAAYELELYKVVPHPNWSSERQALFKAIVELHDEHKGKPQGAFQSFRAILDMSDAGMEAYLARLRRSLGVREPFFGR